MSNKAMVVIDLQNDITKNYRGIIEAVNQAIDRATAQNMDIIYIKHNNLSAGTRTFKPDTHGAEFVPELHIVSENMFMVCLPKRSIWKAPSAQSWTALQTLFFRDARLYLL